MPLPNMNVADIIQNAFDKKPQGVEDAFNNVIQQKMADAIDARREQIAQSMYGSEDDVEPDGDEELDTTEVEEYSDEDV
jgi:hypothetical protein